MTLKHQPRVSDSWHRLRTAGPLPQSVKRKPRTASRDRMHEAHPPACGWRAVRWTRSARPGLRAAGFARCVSAAQTSLIHAGVRGHAAAVDRDTFSFGFDVYSRFTCTCRRRNSLGKKNDFCVTARPANPTCINMLV